MTEQQEKWDLWVLHGPHGPREAHVMPAHDPKEHINKPTCWCQPRIESEPGEAPAYSHNCSTGRKETLQ